MTTAEPTGEAPTTTNELQRGDYALRTLQRLANEVGIGLPLTLTVRGLVISGNLLPVREFFDQEAATLRALAPQVGEASNSVADAFGAVFEELGSEYPEPGSDEWQDVERSPLYIQVADATLFSGSTPISMGLWRGRIAEVSGWSLGRFSEN